MDNIRGLYYDKERKKWRLRLYKNGAPWHLSYHVSKEDAIDTYLALKKPDPKTQNPTALLDLAYRLRVYFEKGV